jgi:hypothetical protein
MRAVVACSPSTGPRHWPSGCARSPTTRNGARTDIINPHADLRAALDMLIKAAEHTATPE